MTQPFQPVVTQAGLQAVFNATSSGFQANVTSIGLGEEGWTPDESASSLKSEKRRIAIGSSNPISDTQIHLTAIEEGDEHSYWVREVGFYLDDGMLLAIWSNPDHPIAEGAQKCPIMRDQDKRALAFTLHGFKPFNRWQIKVVGRLIQ